MGVQVAGVRRVAAEPVELQRLGDHGPGVVQTTLGGGHERLLEHGPLQQPRVAPGAEPGLEVGDHLAEPDRVAEVGPHGLEAVEREHLRVLGARRPRPHQPALGPGEGRGQPQPAGLEDRQPAGEVGLGAPVPEVRGQPEPELQRGDQLVDGETEPHGRVAAQEAERGHLEPPVVGVAGQGQRASYVVQRGREVRARLVDRTARQQGTGPRPGEGGPHGEGAVQQPERVLDGRPAQGVLAGQQPAVGRARLVAGGVRVLGHHLGPVAGQVGGAPVQRERERGRQRGVHALLEEVVGELVVVAAAHEQAQADQLLALPGGGDVGGLDEGGHEGRVDPASQHGGGLDHRAALRVEAGDPAQHRVGQRLGDAGVALAERPEVLDHAQRVPGRPGHHLLAVGGQARGGGQGVDGGAGEGAEPDERGAVGEPRRDLGVLGADGGHDEHPGVTEPAGEVAEQVDRGGTAVLEVVDGQQDGAVEREAAQDGDHGVVRLTALEVDVRRQRRPVRHHGCELGHQGHPGRDVVTDQRRQGGRRGVEDGRAEGVDERLEEERALRGVAAAAQDAAAGGGGQVGHRVQEAGLADAGLALDEHQRRRARRAEPGPGALGLGELGLAADEEGPLDRGPRRCLGREVRLAQHRDVQVDALAVRGRAQLLAQPGGQVVVRRQGRARPAVGDEGAHQGPHGLLVERVGGHALGGDPGRPGRLERGERLGEQVPGAAAQGVGLAAHAQHPVGVVLVDEGRLAAEQLERRAGRGHGERRLARGSPGRGLGGEARRLVEVDHPRSAGGQPVRATGRGQQVGAEQPPGAADEGGHVGGRVGGRFVGPERLDDPVEGDQRPALRGQQGQQGAGLAAAELSSLERVAARPVDRERGGEPDPGRPVALLHASEYAPTPIRLRFAATFPAQRRRRIGGSGAQRLAASAGRRSRARCTSATNAPGAICTLPSGTKPTWATEPPSRTMPIR